ncbi:MAG: response regulator transcription factor [Bacteroides sp.]|nr:response regulator transcription factor [Bacteroides sp.]
MIEPFGNTVTDPGRKRKLTCGIVDDEPLARRGLRRLAEMNDMLHVAWSADCVERAEAMMREVDDVDLLFLDIDMPGESGLEFARRLMGKCMVVFITAYSAFAIDSYEVEAIDYLLKPVQPDRFVKAVEKAFRLKFAEGIKAAPSMTVCVKSDRRYVVVPIADIVYVEGMKDYVMFYLKEKPRVVTRMTMKGALGVLPEEMFLRVNKSFIVNLRMVEAYDSASLTVGGTGIPIGKVYRDAVLARLAGEKK